MLMSKRKQAVRTVGWYIGAVLICCITVFLKPRPYIRYLLIMSDPETAVISEFYPEATATMQGSREKTVLSLPRDIRAANG